jgi:hypothetical protein
MGSAFERSRLGEQCVSRGWATGSCSSATQFIASRSRWSFRGLRIGKNKVEHRRRRVSQSLLSQDKQPQEETDEGQEADAHVLPHFTGGRVDGESRRTHLDVACPHRVVDVVCDEVAAVGKRQEVADVLAKGRRGDVRGGVSKNSAGSKPRALPYAAAAPYASDSSPKTTLVPSRASPVWGILAVSDSGVREQMPAPRWVISREG